MKRISDTAYEKIPPKPDPDLIQSWKNSEVTKWLLANLVYDFFDLHEQLAETNTGDGESDLRGLYIVQGKIEAISAVIPQLEVNNGD